MGENPTSVWICIVSPSMFATFIFSESWFGTTNLSPTYIVVALISPTTSNAVDGVVVPIPNLVSGIPSSDSLPVYNGYNLPSS